MVSHNNSQLLLEKTSDRVPHYGLRKLSYGVAPVLLFSTLYLAGVPGSTAHAATVSAGSNAPAATTESVNSNTDGHAQSSASANSGITTSNQQMAQVSVTSAESISPQVIAASVGAGSVTMIPVHVDHSALDSVVNSANAAGVKVVHSQDNQYTRTQDQISDAINVVQSNEASQATSISAVTSKYLSEKAQQSALTTGYGDTSSLDVLIQQAKNTPGLSVIRDADTTRKFGDSSDGTVRNFNSQRQAEYQSEEEQLRRAIAAQKQKQTDYEKQKSGMANQIKNNPGQQPNYNKRFTGDQVSYTDSNTWTNLPPKTIPTGNGEGITLSGASNVIDANSAKNYHIIGYDSGNTLQNDHIIQKISWDGHNATVISGNGHDGDSFPNAYPIGASGPYNQAITVQSGAKILIPGAVHLADGTTRNLVVQATNLNSEGNPWIVLWNSNGAVNAVSWPQTSHTHNSLGTSLQYWVQGQENEGFLWSQVVSDIDLGQMDSIWDIGESVAVLGLGGGLHLDSGNNQGERINIKASNMLGYPGLFGKDATWGSALNGFSSAPDGVAAYAVYSNSFGHTVSNDPANAYATGVALADFGNAMNLSIPTAPKSEVHYHYTSATAPKPEAPTVNYHYNELSVETGVTKNWNEDGKTTNNKIYIDGDTAHATISTTLNELPNYDNGKLQKFDLVDDYSNFAGQVTVSSVQVLENGVDATKQYTIHDDDQGHVTATRNNLAGAPSGTFTMNIAFKLKTGVTTTAQGNNLLNSGWIDINSHKVPIPPVTVKTTTPDPKKHWTVGEETVDNKLYINDDVAQATVSMTLPQPSDLAHTLTNVSLTDDYSRFAQYVKVLSTHVIENGQDVTNQYTITNENGHMKAVRKDPASTPAGNVKLVVTFKLGDKIPSGTALVNAGCGTLDNDEVPTNTPSVTTYTPDPKKHWVEGDKSVDGKLYINGDTANARIDMNVPKPSDLAQPLHYLSVTDDYHQMKDAVQYVGARVLENGTDVTNQYTIANDGNGHINAVRKQAAVMAGGVVSLLVQFTILGSVPNGTKLINGGSGRLNDDMVPTNEPNIVTYKPDVEKHWTDGDQVVDNHMFIDGDVVNGTVDFNLPTKDQLAKPLSQVVITDDFSQFKNLVDVVGTKVFEAGQDVTSQYTIVNDGNGHVVATRKNASSASSGQLKMVVSFKIHDNVKTNTILVNAGRGQINHEIVPSNQPSISTYEPATEKHWINGQGVVVDNKVYVAGDNVQTRATMTLPDQSKMAKHLTQVSMVDDYSQFRDHVNYQNAQVLVNNQDVTNQFMIQTDLQSGKVTAIAKNPGALPVGSMALVLHFVIKQGTANETKLINSAQGQINNVVVPTNKPSISVYLPAPDKHWTQGGNIVDHKLVIDNDALVGKIYLQLPNKSELADPLTDITLVDDYSKMKSLVDRVSTHVLENGQDATSQYSITDDGQGHVTAVRKNPGAAPKGTVSLLTTFKIHHDVPSNTDLVNQGSATINHQTIPTPTPDVTTYTPTTDKHWVDGDQVVDNHVVIDGDTVTGRVSMTLPTPTDLSQPLTYVDVIDDYSNFNDLVDYVSAKVLENNQDVTSQYTISDDGRGHVMAVRKDPAHTPGGQVVLEAVFKVHSGVKSGTLLINQGSGTLNDQTVPTPTPKIVTYEPKTDKHWVHNGEVIDNKIVVNDDVVTGQVMMDLPKQSTLTHALTDVTVMDDFTQFQGLVDYQGAQVFENGQNVTDQYTIENDGNGHVTATRKNPAVAPEGKVALAITFKLHHDVKSGTELVNGGAGTLNHETVPTPMPKIVTYTPSTDKHWVEGSQNVDGALYLDGETATAQVQMALPDASQLADKLHKVVLTDDFSQFASVVDVAGVKVLENGQDATSQYNVAVDNAGKIVATRKDPASTPSGNAILQVQFTIHDDVKNDTKLVNKGAGQINDDTVLTPTPNVDVYRPDAYKHWTEGGRVVDNKVYVDNDQVSTTVTMTIADPAKYAKGLNQVMLMDDYSQFAGVVKYDGVQVLNNGHDVTKDFTFTNNPQTGLLIATANDPMSLKGGTLNLVMYFTINPGTPNGTKLINSAKGTINNLTVPTNKPAISVYEPQPDKHWMQNGQIVDHKLVVNHDAITAKIDLQLPKQADLANSLSDVEIIDDYGDFASHVDVQGVQVMENGQDVTSQYTVTNDGQYIMAVRKDASHTPDGMVSLIVAFKLKGDAPANLKIVNHGSAQINHETVPTPTPDVTIYTPQTDKHWVEGSQVVDGKVVMDDDLVHTKLDMTLPDTAQLSQPLAKVQLVDDFSQFMDLVDYQSAQVLENGQDVTSQYTITNDGHGHLIATRNDAAKAPAGHVNLLASFLLHHDMKSGVELVNSGSGTLNNETVPMPNPKVVTYEPDTDKHWVEGSQVMDNKTYVDGDEVHADVSMSLPKPDTLAHALTHVSVMDDFSRFMDLVDYQGAQVFENGQDVTSDYTLTDDAQGHITATRKNAAGAPEGMVVLHVNFTIHNDVKSGTELINGGQGQLNFDAVPTPKRTITVYHTTAEKHWELDDQVTDNQLYMNGTQATADVTVNLPDAKNLANKLMHFVMVDDYSHFANHVKVAKVQVLENGHDVTNEYDIQDHEGLIVATRKDASTTPSGTAILRTVFDINGDVSEGTTLENHGSATVNFDTQQVPPTKIVTWNPQPKKDVGTGEVDGGIMDSVNHKLVADGSTLTYGLSNPDLPANRSQKVTSLKVVDKLDNHVEYLGFKAFVKGLDGQMVDITKDFTAMRDGQTITFEQKTDTLDMYNDNLKRVTAMPVIDLYVKVNGQMVKISNQYDLYINNVKTTSNTVDNHTPDAPKPKKEDLNENGVDIDGMNVLPGSVNDYRITADYSQYEGIQADKGLQRFLIVDDFPEDACQPDLSLIKATDSKGQMVDGLEYHIYQSLTNASSEVQAMLKSAGISPKGAFIVAQPKDMGSWFKNYVQTGDSITLEMPMTVKDAFNGQYQNAAYEVDFGHGYATNIVTNNVPKINPHKDAISVDGQNLDGKQIAVGQVFKYDLEGQVLPKNEGHALFQYQFVDDYDQSHDQYFGQYRVYLTSDVQLKDGTILKKGTDVTDKTMQKIDTEKGIVKIAFNKDFLASIDVKNSEFGANVEIQMKRIAAGTVKNTYELWINGKEYKSNTVTTTTPKPKKPAPKPQPTPTPAPKPQAKPLPVPQPAPVKVATPAPAPASKPESPKLPQTGSGEDVMALMALGLALAGLSLGLLKKQRYDLR